MIGQIFHMDVLKKTVFEIHGIRPHAEIFVFGTCKKNFSLQGQGQCIRMSEMTWFS